MAAAPDTSSALIPWPSARPLRAWQRHAMNALAEYEGASFLAAATPAAGKTTLGLRAAHWMLESGRVSRVVVAAPTTHICRQWAMDAARYGLDLEPNRPNAAGPEPADRHGTALTYQTIAAGPGVHAAAASRPTLLIADEPHHMGDQAAWGASARRAFDSATFRLLLSGTPFRSDNAAIPWVIYDGDGVSRADFTYGYPRALRDRVCRPITFVPYDGEMEWRSDGRLRSARFDLALPKVESARRLRTALDPEGDWMGEVLRDADLRLTRVREEEGHLEAGGLVVASDQEHARAIAARLALISGQEPELVMSDEPEASARIARFAASRRRWLVSVLMVSEGVDIPRLRVGVYATAARTELFFRQVVGRFVRRTPSPEKQMSYLLMPADPRLKELAATVEEERRHALELAIAEDEDELLERAEPAESREGFEALSSSAAEAGEAILGETTLQLFATGDDPPPPAPRAPEPPPAAFASREKLRAERRSLVGHVSRKTGEPHSHIHSRVALQTGVRSVGDATREQLEKGNALLLRELTGS